MSSGQPVTTRQLKCRASGRAHSGSAVLRAMADLSHRRAVAHRTHLTLGEEREPDAVEWEYTQQSNASFLTPDR